MIRRNTTLPDVTDKRLPAMKVFELAIKYLKDDLLAASTYKLSGGLQESDIHWTLTVPAIWSERAKQFMREAAVQVRQCCVISPLSSQYSIYILGNGKLHVNEVLFVRPLICGNIDFKN